jgi:hypothetical protein
MASAGFLKLSILEIYFLSLFAHAQNEKKPYHFYDDFNSGKFKPGWRKEITINNNFKIDTLSKQGRNNDGLRCPNESGR